MAKLQKVTSEFTIETYPHWNNAASAVDQNGYEARDAECDALCKKIMDLLQNGEEVNMLVISPKDGGVDYLTIQGLEKELVPVSEQALWGRGIVWKQTHFEVSPKELAESMMTA